MNHTSTIALMLALSAPSLAGAQSSSTSHADMPAMQHAETKIAQSTKTTPQAPTHQAIAIVKAVNPAKGSVTLAHEAIKSLDWPAMTMGFTVKNSKLFDQLTVGSKVTVEIAKQGAAYVITSVK